MEVLLATSMLLASVIVLGELAGIGRRHASAARELATAQLLCENKLNEILAGAAPLAEVDGEPMEDQPGWIYTVKIEPVTQSPGSASRERSSSAPSARRSSPSGSSLSPSNDGGNGLSVLTVTVAPEDEKKLEKDHRSSKEFSLVRWIRDHTSNVSGRSTPTPTSGRSSDSQTAATR
ncbi:MAG: hypothetical protein AB7O26_00740 [Planctomycetaceae bacterium]